MENLAQDNTVRVLNQFGSVVSAKEADRVGCLRNPDTKSANGSQRSQRVERPTKRVKHVFETCV